MEHEGDRGQLPHAGAHRFRPLELRGHLPRPVAHRRGPRALERREQPPLASEHLKAAGVVDQWRRPHPVAQSAPLDAFALCCPEQHMVRRRELEHAGGLVAHRVPPRKVAAAQQQLSDHRVDRSKFAVLRLIKRSATLPSAVEVDRRDSCARGRGRTKTQCADHDSAASPTSDASYPPAFERCPSSHSTGLREAAPPRARPDPRARTAPAGSPCGRSPFQALAPVSRVIQPAAEMLKQEFGLD
eukprot:2879028-Prymnesium_polylepis.2